MGSTPAKWEDFCSAFINYFFFQELREAKAKLFVNLRHSRMSIKVYALRFQQLSRYNHVIVFIMRDRMHKFIQEVSPELVLKTKEALLISNMNISWFVVHLQQVKEEKKKQIEISETQGKRSQPSELCRGQQSSGRLSQRKNKVSGNSQDSRYHLESNYSYFRFCGLYHYSECEKRKNRCLYYGLIGHIN